MHKALFVWLQNTNQIEGESFADWCLGMCLMWNIKSKMTEGTGGNMPL